MEEALIHALKEDGSYEVRAEAATVLGKIKGGNSLDPLLDAMSNDKNASVRAAAAEAVGAFESDRAVKPLINVLYFEKDDNVIVNAMKALKYSSDPRIADPLVAELDSGSERVRWQAIDLIERLRPPDAVDKLRRISEDNYESEGVRTKAKEALELLGDD
ncbi:MAG: HEAT repeat domain-containing protein [Nitrospirota bacterium]